MEKKYILALDQGTSSSRAILFDRRQQMLGMEQQEIQQIYPQHGWVEHNPEEIWQSQVAVVKRLLERLQINAQEIWAIGITNQRETTIIWDKKTGKPVYNAIVWQDTRTTNYCNLLKTEGLEKQVRSKTGLFIDSYFSASKIRWLLQQLPSVQLRAHTGDILFGTVDSWLIWNLTKGKHHVTDYTNASRTMLFNIQELQWDNDMLSLFSVPPQMLPEVKPSSGIIGETHPDIFGAPIAIAGIAGDQQAALFGQRCTAAGMAKNTYGTGCFMLMNTGTKIRTSKSGLISTIAWHIDGQTHYALEGSVFIAGAAIQWLRDGLKIIKSASESEQLATEVQDTDGVYFVPAFTGLGAPYWDMFARGTILGLTRGTTHKHLVRAALESMAYQTRDVLDAMTKDSGTPLKLLNVDGGACANNFLMQFQSDILNTPVVRPKIIETTALGAAFFAGLGSCFWKPDEISANRQLDRTFVPNMDEEKRTDLYRGWLKAIDHSQAWESQ